MIQGERVCVCVCVCVKTINKTKLVYISYIVFWRLSRCELEEDGEDDNKDEEEEGESCG